MNRARLRELGFELGARVEAGVSDEGAWLATAPDKTIYGVMSGTLFRLDPQSKEMTILRAKGCDLLALDRAGRVYFKDRTHLIQYSP